MKFTSQDIQENKSPRNFIRTCVRAETTIIKDKFLFNVYDTKKVIKVLKMKIKKHEGNNYIAKFIPAWEQHIKYLENMKDK